MAKDWSTKLPTKAGYFWLWFGDDMMEPDLVEIQQNFEETRLEVYQTGVEGGVPLENYKGQYWASAGDYPPFPIDVSNVGC